MSTSKDQDRIESTPDQNARIRKATGKNAEAVELSIEELEERIAPGNISFTYTKPEYRYS
jgi:hypothetical protein